MMIVMKPGATEQHIKAVTAQIPEGFRHCKYEAEKRVLIYIEDYGKSEQPNTNLFKDLEMIENVSRLRISLPDQLLQSVHTQPISA